MYHTLILEYSGSDGAYVPYNVPTVSSKDSAIRQADNLRQQTGKCFAVFCGDSQVPCHETSSYYGVFKIPRRNTSRKFDVV